MIKILVNIQYLKPSISKIVNRLRSTYSTFKLFKNYIQTEQNEMERNSLTISKCLDFGARQV